MHNYKVLALDLDDTVLTREKTITAKNKEWIARAHEDGIVVVISTGRGYHNMKHIREELGLDTPMVLVNGAEAWDASVNIIRRDFIVQEDLHLLHELTSRFDADFWSYGENTFIRKADFKPAMLADQCTQFVIRHDDQAILKNISQAIEQAGHQLEITSSSAVNVEFTYKGVSKASGLQAVCDHLGYKMDDVMAIGDNHNDMQLIKRAGLGIAMGNAVPELRAVADDVTGTNEEDGVAKAIKKHLYQI